MDLTEAQLLQLKKKIRESNQQKYLESCRKRLDTIATKKMTTAIIGALDVFEKTFGFLWGHGSDRKLTKDEKVLYELWQKARTDILDNGNAQLRALSAEISNHIIYWKRYHMDLPIVDRKG